MIAILWKGSKEYDKVQDEIMRRDKFKELIMNDDKWNEDLMETDPSGKCSAETFFGLKTLELSEIKKIPTSIEEIEKGKDIKKREIRKKFEKAMDGDDRTGSDIQRGWVVYTETGVLSSASVYQKTHLRKIMPGWSQ